MDSLKSLLDEAGVTLASAEVIRLAPGDVLMLRVDGRISQEMAERLKLVFQDKIPNNTVVVTESAIHATVIHPDA